jgi:hypothetical protein
MLLDQSPLIAVPAVLAVVDHQVWEEIHPLFQQEEFEEPGKMDVEFLRLLHKARKWAGVPFRILDTIRGDPRSAHGEVPCCAADLQVLNSLERSRVVRSLYHVGFTRVGVYEGSFGVFRGMTKKDGGGVHVDGSRSKPPDRMWTRRTL